MRSQIKCREIVGGSSKGKPVYTTQPINFLAMIDARTGTVTDSNHQLYNLAIKDCVLIFPNSVGSSVGAYVFYSLKSNHVAPKAIICTKRADITTASGCAIAEIPLVDMPEKEISIELKNQNHNVIVDADNGLIILT